MSNTEVFSKAAVAAPHHLAAEAGRAILAEGGNALEAMVAMAASIAVVYPHMNAWVATGSGWCATRRQDARHRGLRPRREPGHHRALPRQGVPDDPIPRPRCGADRGRRDRRLGARFGDVEGIGGSCRFATCCRRHRVGAGGLARQSVAGQDRPMEPRSAKKAPGFAGTFSSRVKFPRQARSDQRGIGATLDHLAASGLDDFYRGDIGREIAADLERSAHR